ncbi:MAG: methyltransferase domain-containing protein [Nanoarchaeota archaeon]|nr:methyltransferase domain-containing protein [Nanoarchaeota archaeon]
MSNYFDEIADGYEELYRDEQLRKLMIIKIYLVVRPGDRLLDVGCGSGFSCMVFDCNITGLDPSKELLKKCPFRTVQCEAEDMPFPDNYFDVVIAVTSVHNFDDYEKGLLEIKRVGKSRFAFSILKKTKYFDDIKFFINNNFVVKKTIHEDKDVIFICG